MTPAVAVCHSCGYCGPREQSGTLPRGISPSNDGGKLSFGTPKTFPASRNRRRRFHSEVVKQSRAIMKTRKATKKRNLGGRPPKKDPAIYRYGIKLNLQEKLKFDRMFDLSGVTERSRYIKSVLFDREIKVVKIDKAAMDYYIRLTNFYHQFQAIGNNYNQTTKAIKTNFDEKRGLQMLYRLEKTTIELIVLSKKIVELTREFEEKHLDRRIV
jgi:hypothetical protein